MPSRKAETIEEYISTFPVEIQTKLKQMNSLVKKAAPKAQEAIKYGIPTYIYHGNLLSFAAFKNHIGFYPAPRNEKAFIELKNYKGGKGTVQFELDKPLPSSLITRMVKFRIQKNNEKAQSQKKKS